MNTETEKKYKLSIPFNGAILIDGNVRVQVLSYSEIGGFKQDDKDHAYINVYKSELLAIRELIDEAIRNLD